MRELIYGRNPVMEALQAKRRQAFGLLIADGVKKDAKINDILSLAIGERGTLWVDFEVVVD